MVRSGTIGVRVSEAEMQLISEGARATDLAPATMVRRAALGAARRAIRFRASQAAKDGQRIPLNESPSP